MALNHSLVYRGMRALRCALLLAVVLVLPLSIRVALANESTDQNKTAQQAQAKADVENYQELLEEYLDFDLQRESEKILREARVKLGLVDTNRNRSMAADRQVEAVTAAYEANTVTLDQLLEAQRRRIDAQVSYNRTLCDLCTDRPKAEYMFARANLEAANNSLREAKQLWKKVRAQYVESKEGGESKEEAQSREQYFQFKATTQSLLDDYLRALARYDRTRSGDSKQ